MSEPGNRPDGAWVVYENTEGGGCDLIFQTETAARAYIDRPLDKSEQLMHDRYQEWGGRWADIQVRHEHLRFVPWGKCAAEVEACCRGGSLRCGHTWVERGQVEW